MDILATSNEGSFVNYEIKLSFSLLPPALSFLCLPPCPYLRPFLNPLLPPFAVHALVHPPASQVLSTTAIITILEGLTQCSS